VTVTSLPTAKPRPSAQLLDPDNCAFLFVDHQPQMFFGIGEKVRDTILNAVVALGETAKAFDIPRVLTTVAAESFSGYLIPQLKALFPEDEIIDRSFLNAWEDPNVSAAVNEIGRAKLVFSGQWTEVCVTLPVISALEQGFEVYVVEDACGGVSREVHAQAMQRMTAAGAIPVTWMQVLLELQRDWARKETYDAVGRIVKRHDAAYGLGWTFVETFVASK
jgi:nicotinamidase-related amidase